MENTNHPQTHFFLSLFWQLSRSVAWPTIATPRCPFSQTIHSPVLFHGWRFLWQQKGRKTRLGPDGALSDRHYRGGWDPREVGECPRGCDGGEFARNKAAYSELCVTLSRWCNISDTWMVFECILYREDRTVWNITGFTLSLRKSLDTYNNLS